MGNLGRGAKKGLKEALSITRGEKTAKTETIIRDGVVLEIREKGETVFSLKETFKTAQVLSVEAYDNTADFLRTYRDIVGQTQETMARLYGADVSTYRNWEQGHRNPNSAVRQLMALSVFEPAAFFRMAKANRELEIA
ncbi:MAG: hypothetical protein BMS9Abin05_1995 [Rhodothermia bacterium]|nr:MAG: hypothetical protein BMS9Abin05_1995 [Rhodothermia bacterium]